MATLSEAHEIRHWRDWLPPAEPPEDTSSVAPAPPASSAETDTDTTNIDGAAPIVAPRWRRVFGTRRGWLLPVGAVAVAAGIGGGWLVLAASTGPHSQAHAAPHTSTPAPDLALGGGPGCEPTRQAGFVRGNGPGSLNSGPNAILKFQYGYYQQRSGDAAREATTPDAAVPDASAIQAGIATVPAGTTACVVITPLATDHYQVTVTENRPDASVHSFVQLVTTTQDASAVRITAIHAGS